MNLYTYCLNLIDPFGISRGTRSQVEILLLNFDGGWGEAAPLAYYRETVESVTAKIHEFLALDLGDLDLVESATDRLEPGTPVNQSAKAAIDIALHDRYARRLGKPLWRLLGKAPRSEMYSSFTIGIDTIDVMLQKVEKAKDYAILKVKLGKDLEQDIVVMREIRAAVGDKTIRVDANGGWTLDQAGRAIKVLADLGVEYVEQPLVQGSIMELRQLKRMSPLPIFVDEDSIVSQDLPLLIGAVDGVNIKLMKSGGLSEARRMVALAHGLGFKTMLGCMIETSVGISAAAQLAPFVDYLDLDGNALCSNDPFDGVRMDEKGRIRLSERPGIGVELKKDVVLTPREC